MLAVLGGDVLDDAVRTRAIDFPSGIGEFAANIFDIPANIPTEAKRAINSDSRTDAIEEFQRYFRQQYGIPDPTEELQEFASGGRVTAKKIRNGNSNNTENRKYIGGGKYLTEDQRKDLIEQLYEEMKKAARDLDFERAAELRDEIERLRSLS